MNKLHKKLSVSGTIESLNIGDNVKIRNAQASYCNVYNTAQRVRKKMDRVFTVHLLTSEASTIVTRIM